MKKSMGNTDRKYELSDYEKLRLERIRRNEERLEQLGLLKKNSLPVKKKSPGKKKKKRSFGNNNDSSSIHHQRRRQSKRLSRRIRDQLSNIVPTADSNDRYFDDDTNQSNYFNPEYNPEFRKRSKTKLSQHERRKKLHIDDICRFSKEDYAFLAESVDENFLDKFQEFLEYQDKISPQNVRNVMRQARKLASGEGIRYESKTYGWDEGCYFQKGTRITPMSDFVQLMIEGQECEEKWGRDHGNGWLLSHPLKKLLLFQQFILKNPDFLTSELRLKEYCE